MEKPKAWSELESRIGYTFRDAKLLETALTHASYANECEDEGVESYERLEYLGDAVMGLEIALLIFENGPRMSEGQMTAARSSLVRTEGLARIARSIGLGGYLRLGVGADRTDVRENDTVLEDAIEALAAAVYIDGGTDAARGMVRRLFAEVAGERIKFFSGEGTYADYKSRLQAEMQKKGSIDIHYELKGASGPDHAKQFRVSVICEGRELGTGTGKTKKDAEKMAAKMALEGLKCI